MPSPHLHDDRNAAVLSRRTWLRAGLTTGIGLSLPNMLRLRAMAGDPTRSTSVIFIQMGGGPSQHETYDPKPEAPIEYRGSFKAIPTATPGIHFCELMTRQARLTNDLAIVRSVCHHEASHIAMHMVECGYFLQDRANGLKGEMPAMGAVVSRVRGGAAGLPGFVSLPKHISYCGTAYLGAQYGPFCINGDPNAADFEVANLALGKGLTMSRLEDRDGLRLALDRLATSLDDDRTVRSLDAFQRQALELLTGARARAAFEMGQEPEPLRDRYGRNEVGQRLQLARRLVEADVPFVVVRHTPGSKGADWDDHRDLPQKMANRAPIFDQAIAALIEDLRERGLNRDVLVVAMGEFGRTPRINKDAGRDHWPAVASVLLAGGHYRMGQVIGGTDAYGGAVVDAPYKPQSVLAMVYRHLGIDPAMTFPDLTGRPRFVLEDREPITELL